MSLAPDDLQVGRAYRFNYSSAAGRHCAVLGEYLGCTTGLGFWWFWFREDGADVPYEYAALVNLREVYLEDMA